MSIQTCAAGTIRSSSAIFLSNGNSSAQLKWGTGEIAASHYGLSMNSRFGPQSSAWRLQEVLRSHIFRTP